MKSIQDSTLLDPYKELQCKDSTNWLGTFFKTPKYSDVSLTNCTIDGNGFNSFNNFEKRVVVENIEFNKCKYYISASGVIFKKVSFNNIQTGKGCWFSGCAFEKVVFKGNIGQVVLDWQKVLPSTNKEKSLVDSFSKSNEEYFNGIEWAIDIRDIKSVAFELRGAIPGELVLHNKEDQFLITRETVIQSDLLSSHLLNESSFRFEIEYFMESPYSSTVLVASKRSKSYQEEKRVLVSLKNEGIVE